MDAIVCDMWVCQCCMLSHANGECCADDEHGGDGIAPWSEVNYLAGYTVTMGMLDEEHECHDDNGTRPDECDCERREFSKSRCDGCGSWLHGSRYAFTLWQQVTRLPMSHVNIVAVYATVS